MSFRLHTSFIVTTFLLFSGAFLTNAACPKNTTEDQCSRDWCLSKGQDSQGNGILDCWVNLNDRGLKCVCRHGVARLTGARRSADGHGKPCSKTKDPTCTNQGIDEVEYECCLSDYYGEREGEHCGRFPDWAIVLCVLLPIWFCGSFVFYVKEKNFAQAVLSTPLGIVAYSLYSLYMVLCNCCKEIKNEREAQRKAAREHDAAMLEIAKAHARNSLTQMVDIGGQVAMAVTPSAPPKEGPAGPDSGVPVASVNPIIRK